MLRWSMQGVLVGIGACAEKKNGSFRPATTWADGGKDAGLKPAATTLYAISPGLRAARGQ